MVLFMKGKLRSAQKLTTVLENYSTLMEIYMKEIGKKESGMV